VFFQRLKLIPTGSYEYHGTELPSGTDTLIASAVATDLPAAVADEFAGGVQVFPTLPYGFSPEHAGLPLTAWASHTTYYSFLRELLFSLAQDGDFLVLVNWHGGNVRTLAALENDFNYEHPRCKLFSPPLDPAPVVDLCVELFGEFDQHAGSVEASLIAYHAGAAAARTYANPTPVDLDGALRFFRTAELSPAGVIKREPTIEADPEKGRRVHERMVTCLADTIVDTARSLARFLPPAAG
jgi:creatinine amidohydrolase/Fe(II)-dependent formamide hydrolase-like protein